MAVKHGYRIAESVITQYGEVKINEHGFVANLDELDCSEEQLLELPNFVDGATFKNDAIEVAPPSDEPGGNGQEPVTQDPTDEDYGAFILALEATAEGDDVNSEGYLDMDFLNGKLREKGWPILSGGKRKKLTDAAREAATDDVNQEPVTETVTEPSTDPVVDPDAEVTTDPAADPEAGSTDPVVDPDAEVTDPDDTKE